MASNTDLSNGLLDEGLASSTDSLPEVLKSKEKVWVILATFLYGAAVLSGLESFDRKWHRQHGVAGLVYHSGNATELCSNLTEDTKYTEPCYLGVHMETRHPFLVTMLMPFLVPALSLLGHWQQKRSTAAARRRFVKYLLWYLLFAIVYFVKRGLCQRFDFSDHVLAGVIGLSIAFEEVGCIWQSATDPKVNQEEVLKHAWQYTVFFAAVMVFFFKAYYGYWTCTYFHTPLESAVGFISGAFFIWGCYRMEAKYFSKVLEADAEP